MARPQDRRRSIRFLADMFARNGYFRSPRGPATPQDSHRGYELRFTADDDAERDQILRALARLGIKPGKPYPHNRYQWRIPIYGRDQVDALGKKLKAGSGKGRKSTRASDRRSRR
jgi:hypothetical protein